MAQHANALASWSRTTVARPRTIFFIIIIIIIVIIIFFLTVPPSVSFRFVIVGIKFIGGLPRTNRTTTMNDGKKEPKRTHMVVTYYAYRQT
jgi:hypothetical protein